MTGVARAVSAVLVSCLWVAVFFAGQAQAATFNVTGSSTSGDTISGTLEADAGLLNITGINLTVTGPGLFPDGLYTSGFTYNSPLLNISLSGGIVLSTASLLDAQLIVLATFDPSVCEGNISCENLVTAQRGAVIAAFATPSEVPLPTALPLFASALIGGGVIAWRKRRKQKVQPLAA